MKKFIVFILMMHAPIIYAQDCPKIFYNKKLNQITIDIPYMEFSTPEGVSAYTVKLYSKDSEEVFFSIDPYSFEEIEVQPVIETCKDFDYPESNTGPTINYPNGCIRFSLQNYEDKILLYMKDNSYVYECSNYMVDTTIDIIDNIIYVEILGITPPTIGETALGSAWGKQYLELSDGIYKINFSYNDKIDSYFVEVDSDSVVVTAQNAVFTKYVQEW